MGGITEKQIGNYLETLEISLKKKEELLFHLLDWTKEQETFFKEEEFDADAFDALMEKKGKAIEEINRLDDGFDSIFTLIREPVLERPGLFRRELTEIQEIIRSLTDRGIEIEALERRNQLKLEQILTKNRTRIKQFNRSNGAVAKYYNQMANGGESTNFFVDKKK